MNPLTDWVIEQLETAEEILVPVKKLWKEYLVRNLDVSLQAFTSQLEADERIEFIDGVDDSDLYEDWTAEELESHEQEMEAIGYFSGPRARLKSRIITPEHIAKMINNHSDRMIDSLMDAYDVRPADLDEEDERVLFHAMQRAMKVKRLLA